MKIHILSRDEKPTLEAIEIKGKSISLRISERGTNQYYFICNNGKLKKIRNKKTIGLIDLFIEGFKK